MSTDCSDRACTEDQTPQSAPDLPRTRARRAALETPSLLGSPSTTPDRAKRRRTSVFKEIGLDDDYEDNSAPASLRNMRPRQQVHCRSRPALHDAPVLREQDRSNAEDSAPRFAKSDSAASRTKFPSMTRVYILALILAIALPVLHNSPFVGGAENSIIGVEGRVIKTSAAQERAAIDGELVSRDNSPTDVCIRWSHQSKDVSKFLSRCDTDIF